jgi:Fanconi anemia group M protein
MFVSHPLVKDDSIESRAYQESIVKAAIEKNTLVVAPTALGKTVIAVLMAAHFLERFLGKKILMLAPTRPLTAQHVSSFRDFLKIPEANISLLTGAISAIKRQEIWSSSQVICATPQVVQNDFLSGKYTPQDISLAVFDEAHRAVGGYAYPDIARQLDCRILALTASPGGESETVQEVCKNLIIEHVEIRDENDPDVATYVKGFKIEWKMVELPEPYLVMRNLLQGLLREKLKVLKREGVLKSSSKEVTKKELLSIMSELQRLINIEHRKDLFKSLSAVSGSLTIAHALDLLETQGIGPLHSYLKRTLAKAETKDSSRALREVAFHRDFKRVFAMSIALKDRYKDPKIEALIEIILNTRRNTKIIVFTQYRDTATLVVNALNALEGVKAVRFVGQASKDEDSGLTQKEQLRIVNGFKQGVYNALVATSVAEEGLDIPSVDLVIFYEPVPSEIRSIQRRGRTGRTSIGKVVVLMGKKTRDEGVYWSSVARERRMKKNLRWIKPSSQKTREKKISDWV